MIEEKRKMSELKYYGNHLSCKREKILKHFLNELLTTNKIFVIFSI